MHRAPRPRSEGLIRRPMLIRAWLFLGLIVAILSRAGFFYVLTQAGWLSGARPARTPASTTPTSTRPR